MSIHLHPHHIHFTNIDPLGDGLREEILAEQLEPEAIDLGKGPDESDLADYLVSITQDIQQDSDKLTFSED